MIVGGILGGGWGLFWLVWAAMFIIPLVIVALAGVTQGG